jgi:hypothetical protein
MEEKHYLSDMFNISVSRAMEIIKDIHFALYRDPIIINETLFIDYLKNNYKNNELEFALYVGSRVSEKAAGPHTVLGKIWKVIKS